MSSPAAAHSSAWLTVKASPARMRPGTTTPAMLPKFIALLRMSQGSIRLSRSLTSLEFRVDSTQRSQP